jgi:hypothetical protein
MATFEQFISMMQDEEKNMTASQELKHFNIIPEYYALNKKENKNTFDLGRMKILKYIINCVQKDPINGDYYSADNAIIMEEAGNHLEQTNDMRDMLVWSFIPNRYHREIDNYWSGIGSWIA